MKDRLSDWSSLEKLVGGGQCHFPEDSGEQAQGTRLMDLGQDVTDRPEELSSDKRSHGFVRRVEGQAGAPKTLGPWSSGMDSRPQGSFGSRFTTWAGWKLSSDTFLGLSFSS